MATKNTTASMKDWPTTLRLNATSCALARPVYHATCEVETGGMRRVDFDALPSGVKRAIVAETAEAVQRVKKILSAYDHGLSIEVAAPLRLVTAPGVIGNIAPRVS